MGSGAATMMPSRSKAQHSESSARRARSASPSQLGSRTPSVAPPSVGFGEEDAARRGLAVHHASARIVRLAQGQAADRRRGALLHQGLAVGTAAPAGTDEAALLLQHAAHLVERLGVEGVLGPERLGLLEEPGLHVVEERARALGQGSERNRRLLLLVAARGEY